MSYDNNYYLKLNNNPKSISVKITRYLLLSIIYTIKAIEIIATYLWKIFIFILKIIFWLPGKILKSIVLKIYHLFLKIKRKDQKKEKNILPQYKTKISKILPIVLLILIGILTIANNIFAKPPEPEEFGKKAIISKLITYENKEFLNNDEIIEEAGPAIIPQKTLEEKKVALEAPLPQAQVNLPTPTSTIAMTTNEETALMATALSEEALKEGPRSKIIEYAVEEGDTISGIAEKFQISVASILWSNDLTYYSVIRPGKILKILPTTGLIHTIKKGDTISSIAKKYKADEDKILETNKLTSANQISIGQDLIIPDGIKPAAVITTYTTPTTIFTPPKSSISDSTTKLLWPTTAKKITQYYWWRHPAVDIGGKTGTPIYSAESGTVEVAGWSNGGYGYYIIINHGNGIKTLYAHASKLYVKKGENVSRGQVIMAMGTTGWSTGPHLHFEVRVNGYKRNPLSYIR